MEGIVGGEDGVAATRYQQQLHTNETELKISQEIKIGQRVLLQTKKSGMLTIINVFTCTTIIVLCSV